MKMVGGGAVMLVAVVLITAPWQASALPSIQAG